MSIWCLTENETDQYVPTGPQEDSTMKKSLRSDSQVDAVAAVLLIALAVVFAVVWVSGQ